VGKQLQPSTHRVYGKDPDTKERFTSIPIKVETHSDIKYWRLNFHVPS